VIFSRRKEAVLLPNVDAVLDKVKKFVAVFESERLKNVAKHDHGQSGVAHVLLAQGDAQFHQVLKNTDVVIVGVGEDAGHLLSEDVVHDVSLLAITEKSHFG